MNDKPLLMLIAGPCRSGADEDAATARRRGLPVHHDVADVPHHTPQDAR
ncbi:hypothetical protein [Streptomyces sp. t39]|nr:hypothetical protein [Streptomyces sp. t39]